MPDDSRLPNRRSFLKQVAATSAVGFAATAGASGTAAARLEERYADPLRTEALIEAHADELLDMLADENLLARGDVSELHTRRPISYGDVVAATEGTALAAWEGDRADKVLSVKQVEGGTLTVAVEPDTGKAYAFFDPADEATRYLYKPGEGVFDVNSQDCCVESENCTSYPCDDNGVTRRIKTYTVCCPCGSSDCNTHSTCGC